MNARTSAILRWETIFGSLPVAAPMASVRI